MSTGQFEATPVVLNGILYVTGPQNHAWAIDGSTGKQIWQYQRALPAGLKVCCGPVNRGFAVYGDQLFMTTLDAHLLALDPKDRQGHLGRRARRLQARLREHRRAARRQGQADRRHGRRRVRQPRLHRRVRAGNRQAHLALLDHSRSRRTGQRDLAGRMCSSAAASPTWVTGTYDADLNTVYWGTGNPNPDWDGDSRPGDNLYAASVVALDPDTGKLKWHFQYTPHDTHDWDANQTPVLADLHDQRTAAQGADAGEPQRLPLHARPDERQVHQRVGVCQPELGVGVHP